ncbi:MAG: valine--tRNA ligase [Kiritimatiellae bacterium]|nr:valine--tRNA ligase [Kiritimatiellia bacterium]
MIELDKTYDPKRVEDKWYAWWEQKGAFHSQPDRGGEAYCIVIPPPNVTGILHMGHALNNTIQDILIRWQRMKGRNTVWLPGTDHAGIATQNVVERALLEEKKTRDDLGREAFIERVWDWQRKYGGTIIAQLKKLGASCDWARERFTMDEGLSNAVAEVFIRLYEKGLVYRGNYIINWCPRCQTALADEESEHEPVKGKLYYIRYPIKNGKKREYVTVATTRPETLLGDTGLALHPLDPRFDELQAKTVLLPILERELTVVKDAFVDREFGTGIVKVTPAHDPNDFEMGRRHGLPQINVMNGDGTMNKEAGPYAGLDRFACREKIVEDLRARKLLEKVEEHAHSVGHCYRCHTMVEPRLSPQWFVKMKPLAKPAIDAVKDGRIRFIPERWTKVYLEWMENIRDWCISRQIWWGHRIPVFACEGCGHEWASKEQPAACPACRADKIRQDEDVLDTWFSSWLWPFSSFGWPEGNADLAFYYPSHALVTASEIIFFWVARMIMAGFEFMGDIPFREVYIHGTVRDDEGLKMSKSLGNSIDPLDIIEQYSADSLRFSLMMITATGQDVYVSNDKFEIGRNFCTKIWNAARYIQMQMKNGAVDPTDYSLKMRLLSADDKHIIARLQETIAACTENLKRYRFNDVAHSLYEFVWHQYCDWYVEYSKDILYGNDAARREQVLKVMHYALSHALRLLHPLMPFITEELWHAMGYGAESDSIMRAPWPKAMEEEELQKLGVKRQIVSYVDDKHDLIRIGRTLMKDYGLLPSQELQFVIKPANDRAAKTLEKDRSSIAALLKARALTIDKAFEPGGIVMPSGVSKLGTLYMSIEGLFDKTAETARLAAQLEKVSDHLARVNKKLGNMDFITKAPKKVVETQKALKDDLVEKAEKLKRLIETLSA